MKGSMLRHYRILEKLGAGGQGTVYKALDTKLGRTVVVKILAPELTVRATNLKRFEREARLASSLDHPNICIIFDLDEADGVHFIVMQHVEGRNVRQFVRGRPLELKSALAIAIQVADALAAAHSRGIVHRDIKAGNVMVTPRGQVKVLDFGLAKLLDDGAARSRGIHQTELTEAGAPYGTATYAAPEQAKGERADHRADIFSTGVLLYEMLTGTWPFRGKSNVDVRHAVLYESPKPVAELSPHPLPPRLQEILDRALAKSPDARYPTMGEFREDLLTVWRDVAAGDELAVTEEVGSFAPRHAAGVGMVARGLRWLRAVATGKSSQPPPFKPQSYLRQSDEHPRGSAAHQSSTPAGVAIGDSGAGQSNAPSARAYRFDGVQVDLQKCQVWKDSRKVELEPKAFDVLAFLIENRDRVVSKREILDAVWKDTFVTENAMTRVIGQLRRALGDEAREGKYIETVQKRGYRFAAKVSEHAPPPPVNTQGQRTSTEPRGSGGDTSPTAPATSEATAETKPVAVPDRRLPRWLAPALAAVVVIVGGTLTYRRQANLRRARESIPRVEELARAGNYFAAYDLASATSDYLPEDSTIRWLMPQLTDSLTITSEPAGAQVYLKRFARDDAGESPRRLVGTTPLADASVARGDYILYVEREGYAPVERTISSALSRQPGGPPGKTRVALKLIEESKLPARMVFVHGGEYELAGWGRPTEARVRLADFHIDKYEVTNREYKEFVTTGGYLKREYWPEKFVKDGKEISWEEAAAIMRDRTGLPGPRSWVNGNYPEAKENHPVTDITWYEAAAYARFRGKQLPTIFQWEKAARDGKAALIFGSIMPWGLVSATEPINARANFRGGGTAAVDAFEFGMSPFGAYQMAGNVSEWCLNAQGEGYTSTGGSYESQPYTFANFGAFPTFYSSDKHGFRCVLNFSGATGDQGAMRVDPDEAVPAYAPSSELDFNAWLSHYHYDKTPLEAQVVEARETDEWRREKITFRGAHDERAIAYLYLPKNFPRPLQVIHFAPPDGVYYGVPPTQYVEEILSHSIKAGRAVLVVVLRGYAERQRAADYTPPNKATVRYREQVVEDVTDLRRALDYLESRGDLLDAKRIAYCGASGGGVAGLVTAAVETRYRSVLLIGTGVRKSWLEFVAEANPINLAPHIRAPKLLVNGRYDENLNYRTEVEPLFKLLREPKRQIVAESGHVIPFETGAPIIKNWFDETLGLHPGTLQPLRSK